ncbi:hypothetical protein EVAR_50990_1 [Eumeta japonica]|uniref:Uncharacterized protein n=1 Tax=Eumeta variegata TaxID=151549 RepID=A0A4C1ZYT9_EUMVA|nr:hypothetical protein EVAR_50990_1 [Eumeta japonica]
MIIALIGFKPRFRNPSKINGYDVTGDASGPCDARSNGNNYMSGGGGEPRRKREPPARPNHILLYTIINPAYPITVDVHMIVLQMTLFVIKRPQPARDDVNNAIFKVEKWFPDEMKECINSHFQMQLCVHKDRSARKTSISRPPTKTCRGAAAHRAESARAPTAPPLSSSTALWVNLLFMFFCFASAPSRCRCGAVAV